MLWKMLCSDVISLKIQNNDSGLSIAKQKCTLPNAKRALTHLDGGTLGCLGFSISSGVFNSTGIRGVKKPGQVMVIEPLIHGVAGCTLRLRHSSSS